MKNLHEITQAVIAEIDKLYYLVPKKPTSTTENKADFLEHVLHFVAEYMQLQPANIKGKCKIAEYVTARGYVYWITKKHCKGVITLKAMGWFCGRRDHATVYHGLKRIEELSVYDKKFNRNLKEMEFAFLDKYRKQIFDLTHKGV